MLYLGFSCVSSVEIISYSFLETCTDRYRRQMDIASPQSNMLCTKLNTGTVENKSVNSNDVLRVYGIPKYVQLSAAFVFFERYCCLVCSVNF